MILFKELYFHQEINENTKFIRIKPSNNLNLKNYLEKIPIEKVKEILLNNKINHEIISKKATIDLLINNLHNTIQNLIVKMNNYHVKFIDKLIINKGILKYDVEYLGFLETFHLYGFAFPIIHNNEKMIVMPKETLTIFADVIKKHKEQINLNTTIINYTRGMINLYGMIDIDYLLNKIKEYIKTPMDDSFILSVIYFDCISNKLILDYNNYLHSVFISKHIDNYLKIRETIPYYYPYSDKEIIEAANPEILKDDLITKQHIINIANIFNISIEEAKELMKYLLFALKEDIHYNLLISIIKYLNTDNMNQKIEYILNINDNIPKWSLKGHKYYQVNQISPLTMKKMLELLLSE